MRSSLHVNPTTSTNNQYEIPIFEGVEPVLVCNILTRFTKEKEKKLEDLISGLGAQKLLVN